MIKANFNAYSTYKTDSLHQWDINQVLEVSGLNLTTSPEVHFSNSNTDRAIVRQATLKNGVVSVSIPNSLLQEPLRIFAHIGIYEGTTFKVVELVEIPVTPRKRPEDYQLSTSDKEVYSFKALENALANRATTEQVANIIAHNNDTNGNTELVDVRTGLDDKVYSSAGDAVRAQVSAAMSVKTNGCVYPSNSGAVDFIPDNVSGALDVVIMANGLSFMVGGQSEATSETISRDDIIAQLDGAAVLTDANYIKVSVPSYKALCLDASTKQLALKYTSRVSRYDIVLVANAWANVVGGTLLQRHYTTVNKQLLSNLRANKSTVYVSSNGTVSIETFPSTGKARLTLASTLNYALADGVSTKPVNITVAQIIDQLGTGKAESSGSGVVITLNSQQALCFNTESKTLAVRAINNVEANDIVLLTNTWANVGGELVQKATEFEVKALRDKITEGSIDKEKATEFTNLFGDFGATESFLFFTDPHLAQNGEDYETLMRQYVAVLERYYKSTPTSFVVCGGDWLGNSDTQEEAKYKLGYIDGLMRGTFDKYYHVVGNHDTNYQGVDSSGAANSGRLTNQTIVNLWNREKGQNYYAFEGANTRFIVLDTGLDWETTMTDYRWAQINWLSEQLMNPTKPHTAIFLHIGLETSGASYNVATFASNVLKLCGAYNKKTTITLNGKTYNFGGISGLVVGAFCGHVHDDYTMKVEGIPLIASAQTRSGSTPTFDLCLFNYDLGRLHMVRVGNGESREIYL